MVAERFAAAAPLASPRSEADEQYCALLGDILNTGVDRSDRTGVGTRGVFGRQLRFDLANGFPLLTSKRVHFRSVVVELLWFLRGDTNVDFLHQHGVTIWDEWADAETGDLGRIYGAQWRSWRGPDGEQIDQIAGLIEGLRRDPFSRRHVVSAWNPGELGDMALPPCHCLFQFHVAPDAGGVLRLSCQLYQRSADVFLGVPFNIASYALLTRMVCAVTGYAPGEFVHTLGDAHLYANHLELAQLQLARAPRAAPELALASREDLFAFTPDDITLVGYDPHPPIKAPIAV